MTEQQPVSRAPARPRRRWTKWEKRQYRFLRAYARLGTLTAGARAAGVSRQHAEHWLQGNLAFRQRFAVARAMFEDTLRESLVRHALQGNSTALRFIAIAELSQVSRNLPGRAYHNSDWDRDTERLHEVLRQARKPGRAGPSPPFAA